MCVCLCVCVSAPLGRATLALRQHDQFQASHWSSLRLPTPKLFFGPVEKISPPKKHIDPPPKKMWTPSKKRKKIKPKEQNGNGDTIRIGQEIQ